MRFIEADDKLVNLEHVSSITILTDKLALDLSCVAEIKDDTGNNRVISYYAYCHSGTKEVLENEYVLYNFLRAGNVLINKNHISVIKFIPRTKRVVFNLSHSVTSAGYNKENRLTSKFIYADFDDIDEYEEYVQQVKQFIK